MSSRGWRGNNWRGRWNSKASKRGGSSRGRGASSSWSASNRSTSERNGSSQGGQSHVRQQGQSSLFTCPYKKWMWYLSDEDYIPNSPLVVKVEAFKKYFERNSAQFSKEKVENDHSFTVNYSDLIHDVALIEEIPSLAQDIREQPDNTLQIMGLAFYQVMSCAENTVISQACEGSQSGSSLDVFDLPYIRARISNFEPHTPLKNLKANCFGKLVAVRGTVVRVSNVKPLVTKMAFSCNLCQEVQVVSLPDGKYTLPTKCVSSECRGRLFAPQRSSKLTETIDWQTVRVQEIMDDSQRESGRIPRTVECELTADLVDSCVPGDMVTITGVVKVSNAEEGRKRQNKDKCMFLLYIYGNSVNNNRGSPTTGEEASGLAIEFTLKELYAIQEIQAETNLFRLIVRSLCPSIYGHELVKAGLILGVFGGTQRFANDKNRIPVRGNPHVLVVGDPGLGKSQMLQAVANIAPRGVYVCGNTTSTSGLTVTLSKDGSSGDYALEAGALVLGDQGCCCIDEFDKMGQQHQALLEAMEQQSISIAKAGIVCSLPARTSIIAAANPVGGHYNKAKTVSENLKMGSALLSRFDLVFILLDKPDEEMDSLLSEHVMALHSGKKSAAFSKVTVRRALESTTSSSDEGEVAKGGDEEVDEEGLKQWRADQPLSERLKIGRNESIDPIPGPLLRKYVGYSRKYVNPKLTTAAAEVLQNFYLELRQQHHSCDSTPITTRQLESLIRLTEARARLELREKATRQDAEDVVQIMKYSLFDTYSDAMGFLDFNRSQHGSGMSSRNQAKRFVAELSKIADREYNSLFTVDRMRGIAKDLRLNVRSFDDFLYSLNNQGFLLKKGSRVYQLQTASCL